MAGSRLHEMVPLEPVRGTIKRIIQERDFSYEEGYSEKAQSGMAVVASEIALFKKVKPEAIIRRFHDFLRTPANIMLVQTADDWLTALEQQTVLLDLPILTTTKSATRRRVAEWQEINNVKISNPELIETEIQMASLAFAHFRSALTISRLSCEIMGGSLREMRGLSPRHLSGNACLVFDSQMIARLRERRLPVITANGLPDQRRIKTKLESSASKCTSGITSTGSTSMTGENSQTGLQESLLSRVQYQKRSFSRECRTYGSVSLLAASG